KLFQELSKISKEEKVILEEGIVPKQIYTDQTSFVVEGEKFLKQDTLIMVRKHTRFVNFPKHRHNFIEMIYVYNGEMRQKGGVTPTFLKQREFLFLIQYIEHSF